VVNEEPSARAGVTLSEVRARVIPALLAFPVVALTAWACGSFDSADDSPLDAGSGGDAPADGPRPSDGGGETSTLDGGDASTGIGTLAAPCPRPAAPKCVPSQCARRLLYVPATTGTEFPFGIATDSRYVYWVAMSNVEAGDVAYDGKGTSKIMRVDRSGALNATATVVATDQRRTMAIAMAGDYVYWPVLTNGTQAFLRRTKRDCATKCQVQELTTAPIGSVPILALVAIDDSTLVAAAEDGAISVVTVNALGGIVSGSGSTAEYPALAVTTGNAIAAAAFTSSVQRIPAQTSTAAPFGTVPDASDSNLFAGLSPITTDCDAIYGWRGAGQFWKIPAAGGTAMPFADSGLPGTFSMVADQGFIYNGVPNGPGVVALSLATGAEQNVITGNVHRVAVDDVGMYWGDHAQSTGGSLWMMVK
jgi:hypothetical protein